jgi:PST family polysaccharide transporter
VALVSDALRMGWPMFVFRSAEGLYVVGNAFLLGLFAPPQVVGYFACGEKVSRAAFGLLNPIRDAMFPRLSHLAKAGEHSSAAPLAKVGGMLMIGAGLILGGGIFVTAPLTTALLLGHAFPEAIATLRILACLPVLLAITNAAGIQWLIPFGKEAVINRIIITAGLLNVALALLLAPRFAHIGMACAVVTSEAFVAMSMLVALTRMLPRVKPAVVAVEG